MPINAAGPFLRAMRPAAPTAAIADAERALAEARARGDWAQVALSSSAAPR